MSPEKAEKLKNAVKVALVPVMGALIVKSYRREGGIIGYAYNFRDSGKGRFLVGVLKEGMEDGRDLIRVAGRFLPGITGDVEAADFDIELDDQELPEENVDVIVQTFPEEPQSPSLQTS